MRTARSRRRTSSANAVARPCACDRSFQVLLRVRPRRVDHHGQRRAGHPGAPAVRGPAQSPGSRIGPEMRQTVNSLPLQCRKRCQTARKTVQTVPSSQFSVPSDTVLDSRHFSPPGAPTLPAQVQSNERAVVEQKFAALEARVSSTESATAKVTASALALIGATPVPMMCTYIILYIEVFSMMCTHIRSVFNDVHS